ncbi:hypothetical protein CAEBREN_01446 [Caenorhabditis brenneri]|uniref:Uncharacterized protein n=1 Tax=Caenorhabditis brenneri TaxID=135651 RepID=G0P789_CAEBE|nr:hypothetical protein CAEBREN_01446 [Caenorhabditis brenneri]
MDDSEGELCCLRTKTTKLGYLAVRRRRWPGYRDCCKKRVKLLLDAHFIRWIMLLVDKNNKIANILQVNGKPRLRCEDPDKDQKMSSKLMNSSRS